MFKKIAIFGNSGFAKEVYWHLKNYYKTKQIYSYVNLNFFVDKKFNTGSLIDGNEVINSEDLFKDNDQGIKKYQEFDEVYIAVGNGYIRKEINNRLPFDIRYGTFIFNKDLILANNNKFGCGSFVCAGTIVTCDCTFGFHTQLNLNTTVGHGCKIGNYFTTAPGVNISGDCIIGDHVYFGTNSTVREKIKICDNVTIGMNSCVVKDITEPGIYVGIPAKKIK